MQKVSNISDPISSYSPFITRRYSYSDLFIENVRLEANKFRCFRNEEHPETIFTSLWSGVWKYAGRSYTAQNGTRKDQIFGLQA